MTPSTHCGMDELQPVPVEPPTLEVAQVGRQSKNGPFRLIAGLLRSALAPVANYLWPSHSSLIRLPAAAPTCISETSAQVWENHKQKGPQERSFPVMIPVTPNKVSLDH